MRLIADLFIPGLRVELADTERAISRSLHRLGKVSAAAAGHTARLAPEQTRLTILEDPGGGRLAAGANGVARRDAHRTRRIGVGKRDAPMHQAVEVGSVEIGRAH